MYLAQSPDEEALVSAARNFGFIFKARTPSSITVVVRVITVVVMVITVVVRVITVMRRASLVSEETSDEHRKW